MAGVFDKERLQKYVSETNDVVRPLIRYIRDNYPAVSDKVVCMSYHIKSVVTAIEVMLPIMKT
jgi:predicted RecB family nuclease